MTAPDTEGDLSDTLGDLSLIPNLQVSPEAPTPCAASRLPNCHGNLFEPLCEWQTRLIELFPNKDDEPLRCNLHVADVIHLDGLGLPKERKRVRYEALSYSWGHPDRTAPIFSNGVLTQIPPAMAEALRAIRKSHAAHSGPRWLWCDALCINQDNADEKSLQVRMMPLIFNKAVNVIAWLGSPVPGIDLVFNSHESIVPKTHTRSFHPQTLAVVETLMQREWFRRTWVRQEVFAAISLTLQCGSYWVDFEIFVESAKSLTLLPPHVEILYGRYGKSRPRGDQSVGNLTNQIIQVLAAGVSFGASNPRDRVYALVGMTDFDRYLPGHFPSNCRRAFPIDYSKSVSEVYQDVVKYLINETQTLDCLSYFGGRGRSPNLPSWALDWEDPRDCSMPFLHFDFKHSDGTYQSQHDPYRRALRQNHNNINELHLQDYVIGTVGDHHVTGERHSFGQQPPGMLKWNRNELVLGSDKENRDNPFQKLENSALGVNMSVEVSDRGLAIRHSIKDGSPLPFILRREKLEGRYTLVGAAWFWNGTVPDGPDDRTLHRSRYHTFRFDHWVQNTSEFLQGQGRYRNPLSDQFCHDLEGIDQKRRQDFLDEPEIETFVLR
ncbi:hypothetical protein AYO20_07557 [Fonsecaea nubica]|uniref:Heterokaryon incompatibility domain-containing protein n=1 Tax=Fonsecaea nubica TaxID=856822 RepID=A0A178CTP8_9EURO|nr:hypothetical protein AYO20_07557 [Fonsecaea nubica]OAL33240.1 hypothetical protein AYO20_07557 [Fonsecaea nubica]